jgi:hypothetical protein
MKYVFGQPSLNYRQSTCLKILSDYDFDIKNIKENENKVDDTLSRRVHEMHYKTISVITLNFSMHACLAFGPLAIFSKPSLSWFS